MKLLSFSLLSWVIFLNSCGQSNTSGSIIERESTSVDTFQKIISFPYRINKVHWELEFHNNETQGFVPGPNDWSLFAEVKCDSLQIEAIKSILQSDKARTLNEMYVPSRVRTNWLSPGTKKCFCSSGADLIFRSAIYEIGKAVFPHIPNNGWFSIVDAKTIFLVVSSS